MREISFDWKYPEIFHPVFDFTGRYILLTGGRDSGKSWFVGHKLLDRCLYDKRDVICAREHQDSIEKSSYKLLTKIIKKYSLPYRIKREEIISETTGASFVFVGLSDLTADNIKSFEGYSDVWLEEAQKISAKSWEYLDPTIRQSDAQIFITMNPDVTYDRHPITSELTTFFKHKTLHIHSTVYDNPFADADSLERAELTKINKPEDWRRIWLGIPDNNMGNLIVKGFSREQNVRPLFYQPKLDLHISCDFNYDPMCWCILHKDQNKLYCFDELVKEHTSTAQCAEELIKKYPDHIGNIIINGDAAGNQKNCAFTKPGMTNYLILKNALERHYHRRVELRVHKANPHIVRRFEAFNNLVKRYDGEICFYIDDRCKWTLYNIENAKYIEGTNKVDVPTPNDIKKDPQKKFLIHPLDALTYPAEYYFPIKKD